MTNPRSILCCVDGSSVAGPVCDYAAWVAKKCDAPLKLLHTIEHNHNPAVSDYTGAIGLGSQQELLAELTEVEQSRSRLLIKKGQLMLAAAKERVSAAGVEQIELSQLHGSLSDSLIELEDDIRTLVVGIRGESHEQQAQGIGTQLETVIRALHQPILVVNKEFTQPQTVMLAFDGSEACNKALNMLASSSLFKDLSCHLVHVGNNAESVLEQAAQQLTKAGVQVITAQLEGLVEVALADYQNQNQIDLMVMGAFSHNRFRDFLLGSFTAKMLATTKKPLLLLR